MLLARHPKRPHTLDYIERVITDFHEIHGDRLFADDPAIVCGMGFFEGRAVMIVGEQKGRDTKQKLHRNFGMPKPEGYRKAIRVMELAAKFGCDLIIGVAPMAYEPVDAPDPIRQLVRLIPTRALSRETAYARRKGAEVLLIRPTAAELAVHGANLMRPDAGAEIARSSYDAAARLLDTDRFREALAA